MDKQNKQDQDPEEQLTPVPCLDCGLNKLEIFGVLLQDKRLLLKCSGCGTPQSIRIDNLTINNIQPQTKKSLKYLG